MKNAVIALCSFLFFCGEPTSSLAQAVNVDDSMALVDLYNSANGVNWSVTQKWLQGRIYDNWSGVTLTPDRTRVLKLSLYYSNLIGELPSSLGNLTACETLDFTQNDLSGQIPTTLGNLNNLQNLWLGTNKLKGAIPASIGSLPNLTSLLLGSNKLSGPIPFTLGSTGMLKTLRLEYNKFTFDGMESLVQKNIQNLSYYSQDTILPIKNRQDTLFVSAGGTLQNNTYKWECSGAADTIIVGNPIYVPKKSGDYRVFVSNSIATEFSLSSNYFHASPIIALDPNPSLIAADGSISPFIGNLDYSKAITKAATDGATKLLLVAFSTKSVTFTIIGEGTGMLSSRTDQSVFSKQLTVDPDNIGRAIVIYTVPDGYGKDNQTNKQAYITVSDGARIIGTGRIQLVKPPVVLVHGMWSNQEVWKNGGFIKALNLAGFTDIFPADYSDHAATTFNPNSPESIYGRKAVSEAVAEALWWCRVRGIAATQVDVVGHSLGGLMTRSWSQQPGFKRTENFQKGYVHKLITLGTPHRGSPLGPELAASRYNLFQFRGHTLPVIPLWFPLALINMPIGSCHADFAVASPGITALEATPPYLAYSIVGDQTGQLPGYLLFTLFSHLALNHSYAEIFRAMAPCTNTLTHDLVVPVSSQKGYINTSQTFIATGHSIPALTTETNSPLVQAKVVDLLLSDNTTEFSLGFPAPSSFPLDCTTANQRTSLEVANESSTKGASASLSSNRAIKIVSPLDGTVLTNDSGTTLKFQYENLNGAQTGNSIFLVQNVGWFPVTDSSDNSTTITLPADLSPGRLIIFALARDSSGVTLGDSVTLLVQAAGTLDSISVESLINLDSSMREKHLHVRGYYKDAQGKITASDISRGSAGTMYQPKSGSVFLVSNDGMITGKQGGIDTVIVTSGNKTVKVAVNVNSNITVSSFYPNTISFPPVPDKLPTDQPFALTAKATSGENIIYTLVSGPATLANGVINLNGAVGTVVVKAASPRTAYFDSAISVTRSFHVLTSVVYTFNGNGNWSVPGNWMSGQLPPDNPAGGTTIFINPVANGECVLDKNQIVPPGVNLLIEGGKKFRIVGKLEMQ